jgi:hypothetical protein
MRIKNLIAVCALSVATLAASSARAANVHGSIGFSDGFDSVGPATTSIVSQLNLLDVKNTGTVTLAQGCTTDFGAGCSVLGNFASDFLLGGGAQTIYNYNGFTFQVDSFSAPTRTPLTCSAGLCGDALGFTATGTVSGNGFQPTLFLMSWGATGSCNQGVGITCGSNVVGTWQSTITATGALAPSVTSVPGPGLLATSLFFLATVSFVHFVRRRRSRHIT